MHDGQNNVACHKFPMLLAKFFLYKEEHIHANACLEVLILFVILTSHIQGGFSKKWAKAKGESSKKRQFYVHLLERDLRVKSWMFTWFVNTFCVSLKSYSCVTILWSASRIIAFFPIPTCGMAPSAGPLTYTAPRPVHVRRMSFKTETFFVDVICCDVEGSWFIAQRNKLRKKYLSFKRN